MRAFLAFVLAATSSCAGPELNEWERVTDWKERGVHTPLETALMRAWVKHRLWLDASLREWSVDVTPNGKYGVVYIAYGDGRVAHSLFRVEGETPVLLRHDVSPTMIYDALGDDGATIALRFRHDAVLWTVTRLDGASRSGIFWSVCCGVPKAVEGGFDIGGSVVDYRLRFDGADAALTLEKIHEDTTFTRNTYGAPHPSLPVELSAEEARGLAANLDDLRRRAGEILQRKPASDVARFLAAYADEALPLLKDPQGPWRGSTETPLPGVSRLLEKILKN